MSQGNWQSKEWTPLDIIVKEFTTCLFTCHFRFSMCEVGNALRYVVMILRSQPLSKGGKPDPGYLATSTKLGEQLSCLYFDRYMSTD